MPYGTVKVDNITFDTGGADQNVTASGIYRAITSGVTVSGTISGAVIIGGTSVSGTAVRGKTVTGSTVQGVSGTFTTLTGVTTTGTTANFASGVFTTRISGLTVTGTTAQFTSGTFVSLTGTTVTGTTINARTVNSTTGTFTSLTGTIITGVTVQGTTVIATTGNFTSLTGITTTGTTANFTSGIFTTQVSGLTVTGTQSSFTSGNFITLSGSSVQGGTGTFTSGVFASGLSAANPSISFVNDPNTGIYSPGADQVAISTGGTSRLFVDSTGSVAIGGTGAAGTTLYNQKAITGAVLAAGNQTVATVQSDVTTAAGGYATTLSTAAASFTLSALVHFAATQGTIGAGSTVTTQYGFVVDPTLTGATTNFGFVSDLASATGRWNFYANGTAPNYFAGDVRTNTAFTARTAPANSNTSTTATASSLIDGLRTGTPTGSIDLTLPTGTDMDSAFQELQTNQSFEWSVINLAAATHVITVVAASGHTVVGNMAVAAATSGRFITRKTAANTFISYRIA